MTTCTPIYGLPVVEGSDAPCDIDDWSCAFAAAAESQLDSLDAIVARTATTVPMAWVQRTEPYVLTLVVPADNVPTFDSVIVDTDNMADLTANPFGFTIQRDGLWAYGAYARGSITSAVPIFISGSVKVSPPTSFGSTLANMDNVSYNPSNSIHAISTMQTEQLVAGQAISFDFGFGVSGTPTATFTDISMWACWLGDPV